MGDGMRGGVLGWLVRGRVCVCVCMRARACGVCAD